MSKEADAGGPLPWLQTEGGSLILGSRVRELAARVVAATIEDVAPRREHVLGREGQQTHDPKAEVGALGVPMVGDEPRALAQRQR
eukprot:scaffold7804_cov390-Prasinococcus_capsulatus_cf.AAC.2